MNGGQISAQVYRQVQNGVLFPVDVNGTALVGSGIFPPNYFATAQNTFVNACGVPIGTPFGPQNTYFSTPIAGVQRIYEGFHLNGYFTFGNLVVQPFYDTQVAVANSNDPRFTNPYAITISGAQLPNVPLHRAGLLLDYKPPRSVFEYLVNANYTGSNNGQNLPAYTTVDAGLNWLTPRGAVTFAASNIFNTYGGIFATSQGAVPYVTASGGLIPTVARPNTPRQYSVSYAVRFGQNVPQTTSNAPSLASTMGEGGSGGGRGGLRVVGGGAQGAALRQMLQLPQNPPTNPFALNSWAACNPDSQKIMQPVLDALKAYTAQIEASKTSTGYPATGPTPPVLPGVVVQYHGLGSTYAVSVSTTKTALLRPVFGCVTFHIADQQAAQQRNLYVEPSAGSMFARPTLTFMPAVGLYIARQPPSAGQETIRTYKLPTTAPKTPFAYNPKSPTCTADLRSAAQTALNELQAHFTKGAATPDWTITPHTAKTGTWYTLQPEDLTSAAALVGCGRVSSGVRDDLTKLGWDGAPPPSLSYTPDLGLYIVTGGFQVRQNGTGTPNPNATRRPGGGGEGGGGFGGGFMIPIFGGGRQGQGSPSPSPSPAASASPSPASTPH